MQLAPLAGSSTHLAEALRQEICTTLDGGTRSRLGQFLTPPHVARLLAERFENLEGDVRFLDAGAGVGSLTAAFVEELLRRPIKPTSLHLVAWEIESAFFQGLKTVLESCAERTRAAGIPTTFEVHEEDFIKNAAFLADGLFFQQSPFTHAAMNPPYGKINVDSVERRALRGAGLETSNLYAGFVWLGSKLLNSGGELVAITPRSFCNGPYFLPFRRSFLRLMSLKQVSVFRRRDVLFAGDEVLQENVIFHAVRGASRGKVRIAEWTDSATCTTHRVPYAAVVSPEDPHVVIHLPTMERDLDTTRAALQLTGTLESLGLKVSTGRVVGFRARKFLRPQPTAGSVPLIYPMHLFEGGVRWPIENSRKANALTDGDETVDLRVINGVYVLVKRFTSKEERRRVVAAVFTPKGQLADFGTVGFENHLNYFHNDGAPLNEEIARGLAAFLNSTFVDVYFRQFNGHTQVNASDLRRLRYPNRAQLLSLAPLMHRPLSQEELDAAVERKLALGG